MHQTQVHLVPGLTWPLAGPLLCGGAGGLPAALWERTDRLVGSVAIRGRGDAHGGGGNGFLPSGDQLPSHLAGLVLRAYSEYGRRVGRARWAGVKRREAYKQPPRPGEEGPRAPRCQAGAQQVDFSEKQAAPQRRGSGIKPALQSALGSTTHRR